MQDEGSACRRKNGQIKEIKGGGQKSVPGAVEAVAVSWLTDGD
jgi:hypothetical protein